MPARYTKHIGFIKGLIDFCLLTIVYVVSERYPVPATSPNFTKLFLLYISFFLAVILYRPYANYRANNIFKYLRVQISFLSIQIFITIIAVLVLNIKIKYGGAFFRTYSAALITLFIYRILYFIFVNWYRKKGFNFRTVVIVGYGKTSIELAQSFKKRPEYGYKFKSYFTDGNINDKKVLPLTELYSYCKNNFIDEIFCCIPFVKNSDIENIIDFGEENHIKVRITTDFRGYSNRYFDLEKIQNIPIINISHSPLEIPANRIMKRAFDLFFASIFTLILYFPAYIIFGILIKIDSKGPVLFKQKRTGVKNTEFECLKFRTMALNSECLKGHTKQNDNRVTRIGKILRKTSIDELPQLINVLKGEMSIIGPRPHMVSHTEIFSSEIKHFMARHYVLPGMTGLAQIKGRRGEIKNRYDISDRLKYDKFYIQNWSVFFDIKIALKTISIIFTGDKNAY